MVGPSRTLTAVQKWPKTVQLSKYNNKMTIGQIATIITEISLFTHKAMTLVVREVDAWVHFCLT